MAEEDLERVGQTQNKAFGICLAKGESIDANNISWLDRNRYIILEEEESIAWPEKQHFISFS